MYVFAQDFNLEEYNWVEHTGYIINMFVGELLDTGMTVGGAKYLENNLVIKDYPRQQELSS